MTSHYKVLRSVTPADLEAHHRFAKVLGMIPPEGYVKFSHFRDIGRNCVSNGIAYACSCGILKRISPHERILHLDSVKFWCTQLNEPGYKNTTTNNSTERLYLQMLANLDEWLPGRSFQSYATVLIDGQITRQATTKSFANVEELLHYCIESDYGTKTAQRVIREYLTDSQAGKMSDSLYSITRAALKSYFNVNDQMLDLPRPRKKRADQAPSDDSFMTLEDFYKMLQNGKPSITMRTIMLIKLQSGMDSSTFTDRFNYEGYSQITKYFKTDDHTSWNLDMCPVPIRLVRVKTGVQYTTFLDRDAIAQLQGYLTWKGTRYGSQDASKPLFMTKQNTPIHSLWLSRGFSEVAVRAGIQKKVSHRVYKIRAHEVRDLLKSTLLASGCKQYAADHVLGHAPRDSYEKQATLYPEELRAEYAKASSRINIFLKVEHNLNSPEDPESQNTRIRELEAEVRTLKESKTVDAVTEGAYKDAISEMNEKIKHLMYLFDSLPDSVKEAMATKTKGPDSLT